ncbi:MAG: ferredoxin domain-containing protein [Methanomethylovorans sp.]|jgi:uncharacterized ferredoxin-like protein|uniref:ferredoxin domain-containing protein n=1 Tax=Methanomethylovorans sp. TaxID=2758717 RepID=UPI0035313393
MIENPELECINALAREILVAARTAPKGKGKDDLVTGILERDEQETLARFMEGMADERGDFFAFFKRDARNIRDADAVVLIGLRNAGVVGLNCGACGYKKCDEMLEAQKVKTDFKGPQCSIKYIDLGIALGCAAAKAKDLCIDNRIFYSAGTAAIKAEMIKADIALAIPLSITGKNIFFDRKWP